MPDDPIAAFWRWWPTVAAAVAAQINEGPDDVLAGDISARVQAIDERLEWELAQGERARHALVVTPAGNAEVRALAARWARAAPPPVATWEYHSARRAPPYRLEATLRIRGLEFDLAETVCTFEPDDERELVHLTVHHPVFPEADETACATVTFLALDWLLGEDDVERHVGSVETVDDPPDGALPITSALETAIARYRRDRDEPRGVLLEGRDGEGMPLLVSAQRPLRPVDHPLLDTCVSVVFEFDPRNDGLPEPDVLRHLRALEDDLLRELSDDVVLAAHVTHAGERELLLYVDGTGADAHRAKAWQRRNLDEGAVDVRVQHDPAWEAVKPFR